MKISITSKLYLLFLLLPSILSLSAQDCLPAGITFTLQNQIDNFPINYPGCTTIEGEVSINAGPDGAIFNLNGLAQLTAIEGGLRITNNPDLVTLTGLDNLVTIGQSLDIVFNPSLENLDGLEALQSIGNTLLVERNEMLVSVAGLSSLTAVGNAVRIRDQLSLPNLTGLEQLTEIGGTLLLIRNAALESITGLSELETVGALLSIVDNVSLPTLEGLESLHSVGEGITINFNDQLMNLDGLSGVQSIDGDLQVMFNDILTDISGIAEIDPAGINVLFLRFNPTLSSCAVQSICEFVGEAGNIAIITDNDSDNAGCNTRAELETQCETLLPVVWTAPLTARPEKENILLRWSVARQMDNSRFEVQHSTGGVVFKTVGQLPGETFAVAERTYTYQHFPSSTGDHYYRIRQVDMDGTFSFSNLVSVHIESSIIPSVYPNPVADILYLRGAEKGAILMLSNATGQVLYQEQWSGEPLDFGNYPPGIYWLMVTNEQEQITYRLVH